MQKNNTPLQLDADAVNKTAEIMKTSTRNVRYVLGGRHKNPMIKALYTAYVTGKKVLLEATSEALDAGDIVN